MSPKRTRLSRSVDLSKETLQTTTEGLMTYSTLTQGDAALREEQERAREKELPTESQQLLWGERTIPGPQHDRKWVTGTGAGTWELTHMGLHINWSLQTRGTSHSLEGLMLKLKLQYFGHLLRRADSFEKTLMLGKSEGGRRREDRGWDGWMASPTEWTWVRVNSGSWWWTGRPGVLRFMGWQRVGHDWVT